MNVLDHGEFPLDLENKKIDAVAVAISSWHILGIEAFIYNLSNNLNRKVNVLILILPHAEDGYLIDKEDFFQSDFADIKFDYVETIPENQNFIRERVPNFINKYKDIFSGLRHIRSNNGTNKLYLVSPLLPYIELLIYFDNKTISSKYDPVFVLVDEGYGTYVSKGNWDIANRKDYPLLDFISSKIFRSVDYIFRKMLSEYIPIENRFLFRKESPLKINENISNSYKEVLKLKKNSLDIDIHDKTILIIPQPFSELNYVTLEEELRVMSSLIKFINKKGIKPLLKPHPREKKDKYANLKDCDFGIIENNSPVEEIIPHLNPICVIGYTSTALLNSKAFFGITAISLMDILTMKDDAMDVDEEFKILTSNYVNFVDKIEDLDKLI
jgi:hypothetical protein